jgi:flagellar biosynthesis/type III secretory pathway chaperone
MRAYDAASETLVGDLTDMLDREIDLLGTKTRLMDALGQAVVRRDDRTVEQLMADIERIQSDQDAADSRLTALRRTLARQLGMEQDAPRLREVLDQLPADQAALLEQRREHILVLGEQLRRGHLKLAMLLSECARINRMMLAAVSAGSEPVTTYDAEGAACNPAGPGLLDQEL